MKRIKVKSSSGKRTIFLPEWWGEVKTAQYERLVKEWDASDLVKLFSILSGIEYKTLSETHDANLENALIESVRFVYDTKPAFKEAKPPLFVTIEGRNVPIPKKLGSLSIGQSIVVKQFMDANGLVNDKGEYNYDMCISFATAIYLQPAYDGGEFNYEKALALHEKVLELPITETYPVGFFLLRPLMKSGQTTRNVISRTITRLWQGFTKNVGTLVRWRRFRGLKEQGI